MSNGKSVGSSVSVELEHAIGYSGGVQRSIFCHPNGKEYVYVAGACIVICDLTDAHKQEFLRGHDDLVSAIKLSDNGKLVASGQIGENADICVWDFENRKLLHRLTEHDYGISDIDISHDGKLIVSVGHFRDNRIVIWDSTTGYIVTHTLLDKHFSKTTNMDPNVRNKSVIRFGGHTRDVKKRETKNYQFVVTCDKRLWYFDLDPYKGKLDRELFYSKQHRTFVTCEFNHDGSVVYAGTSSGDVLLFGVRRKQLINFIRVCSFGVPSLIITKEENIFVGGGDGTLTEFRIDNITKKFVSKNIIQVSHGAVKTITPSTDNKKLFIGCRTGDMHTMDVKSFSPKVHSESHYDKVVDINYPKGINDKFVSCSRDKSIQYWNLADYSVLFSTQYKGKATPNWVGFVGDIVFSGWSNGDIRTIDSLNGEKLFEKVGAHRKGVTCMVPGDNEKFLLTGGEEGEIKVWSVKGVSLVSHFKEHNLKVTELEIFDDDYHFLSCSHDKSIFCWDLKKERVISTYRNKLTPIESVTLHKDQVQFVSVGKKVMIFWDIRQPKPTKIMKYAGGGTSKQSSNDQFSQPEGLTVKFSNDSKYFAVAGTDEIVNLYEYNNCKLVARGAGHSAQINRIRFSPDDKQIVSAGDDGMCLVWNKFSF